MSYVKTPEHIQKIVEARRKNPKFMEHLMTMNASRKGTKLTEEHKRKIGKGGKGRVLSPETRAKIGAKHKGKIVSQETRLKQSRAKMGHNYNNVGPNHHSWKGDKVKYRQLHAWVARYKLRSGICSECSAVGKTHFANISGKYRRDLEDFMEMCVSCHRRYDLARDIK